MRLRIRGAPTRTARATTILAALVLAALVTAAATPAGGQVRLPFDYPLAGAVTILHRFDPPPVRWQAGHLGVDFAAADGVAVRAPGSGVVSFAGTVVDRGIVVIDHGQLAGRRLRSTLEPLAPAVAAGQRVAQGQVVGTRAGPHRSCGPTACLHWGVRLDEEYRDPLAFLRERRIAVLLPLR